MNNKKLSPRDTVKLAFQYQETNHVPTYLPLSAEHETALTNYYGNDSWRDMLVPYFQFLPFPDGFLTQAGMQKLDGNCELDSLGCTWDMGSTHHLLGWPLQEPHLGDYRLPDLQPYYQQYLYPDWAEEIATGQDSFRITTHVFGLFERAWTLRGFENLLMDLAVEEKFVEELLDHITEWMLQSIDLMAAAPIDAIMLTDDKI